MATPNTIELLSQPGVDFFRKEAPAKSAITPGEILEWSSDDKLQAHSEADGEAQKMIAVEDKLAGNEIDDDYAADDEVQYDIMRRGEEFYAFIKANESDVAKGDALVSDGAGALQLYADQAVDEGGTATYTLNSDKIIAYAAEDKTSIGTSRERIKIEAA